MSVRPGELRRILPIRYKRVSFGRIGITAEIFMDDGPPAQSGLVLSRDEIPSNGHDEKLGQENFIPPLHGGLGVQLSSVPPFLIRRIRARIEEATQI